MANPDPRAVLTDLAAHMREIYGRDAADLIRNWRDRHYPESTRANHRWSRINRRVDGVWINRRCARCELVDQFGPLDDREVAHYVLPDGSTVKKAHRGTPRCRPASALSRNPKEK